MLWTVGIALGVEVRGTVVDDAEVGVPEALLVFGEGDVRAQTDEIGAFVTDLPVGTVVVEVKTLDYLPYRAELAVVEGMEPVVFVLQQGDAYEIDVLFYKDPDPVVTRRRVSAGEVRKVPGAFGDPVRVVTSLPGAARPPFGGGSLIIRGGNEDDTSVFVDGVEIPIVYHLGGYRSVIHPSLVANVDFLPGVFPSRYGDTIGGVVDIETKAEFGEFESTAHIDLLDTSAATRGAIADSVGFAASIRRSYIDGLLAPVFEDAAILPRWFDYQLQVQSLQTGDHTFRLFAFGLIDQLGREDSDFPVTTAYGSHRIVGSWVYEPSDRFRWLLQPTMGFDDEQTGIGSAASLTETGLRLGVRSEAKWRPSEAVAVTAGADVQADQIEFVAELPFDPMAPDEANSAFEASDDRWIVKPDPYVELELRPADPFVLTAGLRAQTLLRQGFDAQMGLSPRTSMRLDVWKGGTLKGGAGLFHQAPSGRALAFSSDVELSLERAWTAEVGIEQQADDVGSVDLVVYTKRMENIASQQFGRPSFDNTGIGRANGLELLVKRAEGDPLFGWVSYSLSRSERIADPDVDDTWTLYDFDQTHNLIAVAGYTLPKKWDLSARFQYTSGNPYTPYEDAVYDLNNGSYTPIAAPTNSDRLPPYIALDLRVAKTWTWRKGELKAYLDLLNAIQGENPEFVQYAYDYSEQEFISGLPTLPAFGVEGSWRF